MSRSKLRQRKTRRPPRLFLGRFTPAETVLISFGALIVLILVAMAALSLLGGGF